jgi:hypothetical protein
MDEEGGYTLVELMMATMIAAVIGVALVRFISHIVPMMRQSHQRQELLIQSRTCMDNILEQLRNGKADSVVISTPNKAPQVPNSQINFSLATPLTSGTTSFMIYLDSGTVYSQEYGAVIPRSRHALAKNVTGLIFTGSSIDPGVIKVTLRMDAPWDPSNDPNRMASITLTNQSVRLLEGQ